MSSIVTMNMTCEQKHFFECIRKEHFLKRNKLSNYCLKYYSSDVINPRIYVHVLRD